MTPEKRAPLPPEILDRCREMRASATDAENRLWFFLRGRRLKNAKFRRQHSLGPYILDFYCREACLAIELDGGGHLEPAQAERDQVRTEFLREQGVDVIRFWNNEVLEQTEAVLGVIWERLGEAHSL